MGQPVWRFAIGLAPNPPIVAGVKPYAAIFMLISAAACSRPVMHVPPTPSLKLGCGSASYYHDALAGNLTASGETFDPERFTAAHNTLPFDTVLRVTRRDDGEDAGKTVVVRINDRGPFVNDVDGNPRIIDLSPRAAEHLGLTDGDGVAEVCLLG